MKRKFYRSCVAVLLSMVMIFGGVNFGVVAKVVVPPIYSSVEVEITNIQDTTAPSATLQMTYSASIPGGTATWSSSNTSVATVNANGLVTGVSFGWTNITVTYTYTGLVDSDSFVVYVANDETGVKTNTEYYIMNLAYKFISLEESSNGSLTNVCVDDRSYMSKWKILLQSTGSYQIFNSYIPSTKCLTAIEDNLCIDTNAKAYSQKFVIERIESGNAQGLFFIKQGAKYVAQDENGNLYLTPTETAVCYWSFMAVEKRYADIFAFDYMRYEYGLRVPFDTTANVDYYVETMNDLNYIGRPYENYNSDSGFACLIDDDIFVFDGHGTVGCIAFCEENDVTIGRIVAHSDMGFSSPSTYCISELPTNSLALSRFIFYSACQTACDYTLQDGATSYNLLDETFNKGAHFVLGFTEQVLIPNTNDWLEYFLDNINKGYNINEAIDEATDKVGGVFVIVGDKGSSQLEYRSELPLDYRGDGFQYLNLQ